MLLMCLFIAANPDMVSGLCDFIVNYIMPAFKVEYLLTPLVNLEEANKAFVKNVNPFARFRSWKKANEKTE